MAGEQSVRPFQQHRTGRRGLSHKVDEADEEPDDMFVTTDGEMLPKDVVERDAETARTDAEDEQDGAAVGNEEVEEAVIKARRAPKEPTEAEVIRHEAAHLPYRFWCQTCVRARGRSKPHYRKVEKEEENVVHKVSMDYFF